MNLEREKRGIGEKKKKKEKKKKQRRKKVEIGLTEINKGEREIIKEEKKWAPLNKKIT